MFSTVDVGILHILPISLRSTQQSFFSTQMPFLCFHQLLVSTQQHRRWEGRERENEQSKGQQRRSDYTDVSKMSKGKQRVQGTKGAKGPATGVKLATESLSCHSKVMWAYCDFYSNGATMPNDSWLNHSNMISIWSQYVKHWLPIGCLSFHVNVVVKLHPLNSRRKFHEDLL